MTRFRARHGFALLLGTAVCAGAATFSQPSHAVCSVLSHHPCIPHRVFCSVSSGHPCFAPCSVFRHRPCTPEVLYPFGQQLQLTIETRRSPSGPAFDGDKLDDASGSKLDTIQDAFAALRLCWIPPEEDHASSGLQMSVRLSFKRNGEVFGKPRVTYLTPGTSAEVQQVYWRSAADAFERCTPLRFTASLGGALAGRPFAIRFVETRDRQSLMTDH